MTVRSFTGYLEAETLIDPPGPIVARRDGNVDALVWRPREHFLEQSIDQPRPPVGGCDPDLNDIHGVNGGDAGEHPDAVIVGVDRDPRGARRVAESTSRLFHPELISTPLSGSERRTESGRRVGQRAQPCRAEQGLITWLQTADGGNHGLTLAASRPKLPATYRSRCAVFQWGGEVTVGVMGRAISAPSTGVSDGPCPRDAGPEAVGHDVDVEALTNVGLGLDYDTTRLDRTTEDWLVAGSGLRNRVAEILATVAMGVEQVGSSSVLGLLAKPIVDLAVGLSADHDLPAVTSRLEAAGWIYRGDAGDDGGHVFVLEARAWHRVAHLHVVEYGGEQWRDYVRFRDLLRSSSEARDRYEAVKLTLIEEHRDDRKAYTDGKSAVVRSLLHRVE